MQMMVQQLVYWFEIWSPHMAAALGSYIVGEIIGTVAWGLIGGDVPPVVVDEYD